MKLLRKIYYKLSPQMRLVSRKIVYYPHDIYREIMGKRSKYEPRKGDIYIGSGDFIAQGKHHLDLLIKHANLKPSDKVLDIGSGIGRTAVALTNYLSEKGKYEGFDVVEKGVKWCNNKIKKDFPNFNFIYVPLNNDLYNTSSKKATNFTFPYPDNSFDKVFLFSVFTHMSVDEIANYLSEIKRVIKPDGICLSTFFVYSIDYENKIEKNKDFPFPIKKEKYRLMSENVKSANIALREDLLDNLIFQASLTKMKIIQGYWKEGIEDIKNNDFQDIVLLTS